MLNRTAKQAQLALALVLLALCGAVTLARTRLGWFQDRGTFQTRYLPCSLEARSWPPLMHVRVREVGPGELAVGATLRDAWFIATDAELGPQGSVVVHHGEGLGTTLLPSTGETIWCAADGEHARIREDGRDALLESEAGWLDAASGCALIDGDAGWVGSERAEVHADGVYFRGRVVSAGAWLEQASGGVAIRSTDRWIATLGPAGVTPIDPALSALLSSARTRPRHGGVCVDVPGVGDPDFWYWKLTVHGQGPDSQFVRCLRFRDGRVFDHPGLPIDVDLSLVGSRFVDLVSGQDSTFPPWSTEPFYVPESWDGGCEEFVYRDGEIRRGMCW